MKNISFNNQLKFPDFFINDLISAYAMEVLSPDKLEILSFNINGHIIVELEKKLEEITQQSDEIENELIRLEEDGAFNPNNIEGKSEEEYETLCDKWRELIDQKEDYKKELAPYTSVLAQQFHDNEANRHTPFYAGGGTIGQGSANYTENGETYGYADCAETAVRQFLSVLLCTGHGRDIKLAEERVPKGSLIRKFLTLPSGELRTIEELATGTSKKVRNDFAAVVNGHKSKGIKYADGVHTATSGGYQLASDMASFAKLICRLLEGYKGVPKVEQRIREVNQSAENGTFANTVEHVTEVFTDLAKIRTDTQIDIKFNFYKSNSNAIEGNIMITFPNPITEGAEDNSELNLHVAGSHADFFSKIKASATTSGNHFFDPWSKKLYGTEIKYDYGFERELSILNYYSELSKRFLNEGIKNNLYTQENTAGLARLFTRSINPVGLSDFVDEYNFQLSDITSYLIQQVLDNTFAIANNPNDEIRKKNLAFSILYLSKNKSDFDKAGAKTKFEAKTEHYDPLKRAVLEHFLFGAVVNDELVRQAAVDPFKFLDAVETEIYKDLMIYQKHMNAAPEAMPIEILTKIIAPHMEKMLQDPATTYEIWSKFVHALNMFNLDQLDPESEKMLKDVAMLGINRYNPFSVELNPNFWRASTKNLEILLLLFHFSSYESVSLSRIFGTTYKNKVSASVLPAFLLILPEKEVLSAFELTDFSHGQLMMRDFLNFANDNNMSYKISVIRKIFEIFKDHIKSVTPEDIINVKFPHLNVQFYQSLQKDQGELQKYFSAPENGKRIFEKIDQLPSNEDKNRAMQNLLSVIHTENLEEFFVSNPNCVEFLKTLCLSIIDLNKKLQIDLPKIHAEVSVFTKTVSDLQKIIDKTLPLGDDSFWNYLFRECAKNCSTKEELDPLLALTDKYFEGKFKQEILLEGFAQNTEKFKIVAENYRFEIDNEQVWRSRMLRYIPYIYDPAVVNELLEIDTKYFEGKFHKTIQEKANSNFS